VSPEFIQSHALAVDVRLEVKGYAEDQNETEQLKGSRAKRVRGPIPVPLTPLVHHPRDARFTFSWDGEGVVSAPRSGRAVGQARMTEAISEAGDGVIAAEQKIRRRRIADRPAALMRVDLDQRARMR